MANLAIFHLKYSYLTHVSLSEKREAGFIFSKLYLERMEI